MCSVASLRRRPVFKRLQTFPSYVTTLAMLTALLLLGLFALVRSYEVSVSDHDLDRQICSGMWAGHETYINGMQRQSSPLYWSDDISFIVTFEPHSQGQLTMVLYEWKDVPYLGKPTSELDDTLPVSLVFGISSAIFNHTEDLHLHGRCFEQGLMRGRGTWLFYLQLTSR